MYKCIIIVIIFTHSLTLTHSHSLTHSLTHTHTVTVALSQLEYLTSEAEGSVEVCVAVVAGSLLENLTLTLTTADDTATSNGNLITKMKKNRIFFF